jgi:hypothetical protein
VLIVYVFGSRTPRCFPNCSGRKHPCAHSATPRSHSCQTAVQGRRSCRPRVVFCPHERVARCAPCAVVACCSCGTIPIRYSDSAHRAVYSLHCASQSPQETQRKLMSTLEDINRALLQLNDALCSYERNALLLIPTSPPSPSMSPSMASPLP